jgi:hypothetical protein
MHQIFAEELRAQGRRFRPVEGPREERLRQAVGYIEELLEGFRRV